VRASAAFPLEIEGLREEVALEATFFADLDIVFALAFAFGIG
jgi:hypothetical protein